MGRGAGGGGPLRIDLHLHSTASDGALAPVAVMERAHAGGLDLVALADHDTVMGVAEAQAAASPDLRVVPAIEISANHGGRDIHVLGYGIAVEHPAMVEHTRRAREGREERIRQMLERLSGLNVDVAMEAVRAEAGPEAAILARPHLARALQSAGHVDSIGEAFNRFIGDDGPAYVPNRLVDVPGAIALIHEAGGVASWAHPSFAILGDTLPAFVEAGLDALECYRPRLTPAERKRMVRYARKHGLLRTGGSDWHGDWHGELGAFAMERDQVAELLERLGV